MDKKKFNLVNYVWIIPLVIGIIVGFIGINKINQANDMYVPPMGNDGWFDARTSQSNAEFSGIFTCTIGFFVIGLMGTIMCFTIPRAIKASKKRMQSFNNILQPESQTADITPPNKNPRVCAYCGSLVKPGEVKCSSCGGKEFKNAKH